MTAEGRKQKRAGSCIIIGAGELTNGPVTAGEEDLVIAVDGGFGYCGILGLEPDFLIGDFDSISETDRRAMDAIKERHPERVIALCPEKDDTDMLAALKLGLGKGYKEFRIYAATGGRLEHTIANIQCLLYLKQQGAAGFLNCGGGEIFVMKNEQIQFSKEKRGYLSLFSLGKEARGVSISGLKYPLEDYTMRNDFPIGVSNEFMGCEGVVSVREGELVGIVSRIERRPDETE